MLQRRGNGGDEAGRGGLGTTCSASRTVEDLFKAAGYVFRVSEALATTRNHLKTTKQTTNHSF